MPELVETGQISRGIRLRYRFYAWFMRALPAKTRTENVPEPPPVGTQ